MRKSDGFSFFRPFGTGSSKVYTSTDSSDVAATTNAKPHLIPDTVAEANQDDQESTIGVETAITN